MSGLVGQVDSLQTLFERLRRCQSELEQAALARILEIATPSPLTDPTYVVGLRSALAAAFRYGLEGLAEADREPPPVPVELLAQARLAARNGVTLDTIVRRYSAGHSILANGVLEEATALRLAAPDLQVVLRALTARYDRIIAMVSEEYERESSAQPRSAEGRRYALLRRLISGEPVDATALGYEFSGHHLALVVAGREPIAALEALGGRLDRRLLLAAPDAQLAWGWFGGRRPFGSEELDLVFSHTWGEGSAAACGEPGQGLAGWRLSHHQAAVAIHISRSVPERMVRYREVALLAAALRDEVLATSLRRTYLEPLEQNPDAGETIKETLRAYLAAACNSTSAAAALEVSRRTVAKRLLTVENLLGRPLTDVAAELEVALRLDRYQHSRTDESADEGVLDSANRTGHRYSHWQEASIHHT